MRIATKEGNAEWVYKRVFRPPRPPFKYEPWMDVFVAIENKRQQGVYVDPVGFQEAFEAGLYGDLEAVDSYICMYELTKD